MFTCVLTGLNPHEIAHALARANFKAEAQHVLTTLVRCFQEIFTVQVNTPLLLTSFDGMYGQKLGFFFMFRFAFFSLVFVVTFTVSCSEGRYGKIESDTV